MHRALSDNVQHIDERKKVFTIDFPLTKGLRHVVEITPIFFEKDYSSDLWEVATCLSKLL